AVVSTALTLAVGLPAAYVVARFDFPGRRAFRAFVTVPFVLPTVVVATAFLALFRPGGPLSFLHWQRGIAPMLVAHVFFNVAAARARVEIVAVLAVVFGLARAQERRAVTQRLVGGADAARRPRGREKVVVGGVVGATVVFLGGPLAVLVWRSLHVGGNWSVGS